MRPDFLAVDFSFLKSLLSKPGISPIVIASTEKKKLTHVIAKERSDCGNLKIGFVFSNSITQNTARGTTKLALFFQFNHE